MKDRLKYWLEVRRAKRWAKREEARVLVERYRKAQSKEVLYEERQRLMKKGIFI
jgi:hypothetical protein